MLNREIKEATSQQVDVEYERCKDKNYKLKLSNDKYIICRMLIGRNKLLVKFSFKEDRFSVTQEADVLHEDSYF